MPEPGTVQAKLRSLTAKTSHEKRVIPGCVADGTLERIGPGLSALSGEYAVRSTEPDSLALINALGKGFVTIQFDAVVLACDTRQIVGETPGHDSECVFVFRGHGAPTVQLKETSNA